ncbi:dhhc zinc finger domain containing protein [Stylonychia lemnae]|uniref:Dhhc zinc finger domain containing protein n=1 Tax=Stylonychia lemnae TaxID=5949 RepID=A0A078B4V9_STYLE|nr:dhhc zinc finger domain containing protein [Stylonychia lemnae]|eukprot:CDW88262.1 dhhc zinc finger domain containing protein [Stylonychia lemnae]
MNLGAQNLSEPLLSRESEDEYTKEELFYETQPQIGRQNTESPKKSSKKQHYTYKSFHLSHQRKVCATSTADISKNTEDLEEAFRIAVCKEGQLGEGGKESRTIGSLTELEKQPQMTPLQLAALVGNSDMIKYLVKFGCKKEELTSSGQNMIHLGAQANKPFTIVYFKEQGLNINLQDNRGQTPLHLACINDSYTSFHYLIAQKADKMIKDNKGLTALHHAVLSSFKTQSDYLLIKLILKGASRDVKDNYGRYPVDLLENFTPRDKADVDDQTSTFTVDMFYLFSLFLYLCCWIRDPGSTKSKDISIQKVQSVIKKEKKFSQLVARKNHLLFIGFLFSTFGLILTTIIVSIKAIAVQPQENISKYLEFDLDRDMTFNNDQHSDEAIYQFNHIYVSYFIYNLLCIFNLLIACVFVIPLSYLLMLQLHNYYSKHFKKQKITQDSVYGINKNNVNKDIN